MESEFGLNEPFVYEVGNSQTLVKSGDQKSREYFVRT